MTALMLAVFNGHAWIAQLDVLASADKDLQDVHGMTALKFTVLNGHSGIVQLTCQLQNAMVLR